MQFPGQGRQPEAGGSARRAGDQGQAAHRGDAGQGLAPEPQSGDVEEVGLIPELAGGVALQAQEGLLRGHAPAVVHHPQAPAPPLLDLHHQGPGPGVQGVFHQFLDHRGGTQDDLPRGNLGRHLGRQTPGWPALFLPLALAQSLVYHFSLRRAVTRFFLTRPAGHQDGLLLARGAFFEF